jgi:hypothetical protein
MIATVFLGPSMPLSEARAILPDAIYRPPAEQGDLLAAVDQDGAELIGLIDGTFRQNLSVWHSEVCYVLSRGVSVFGASSMGALRAVETERFGAVGIGTIFQWYRDEVITGDDEVALLHGDADSAFVSLSIPMVNIRASVARALAAGVLAPACAEKVLAIAHELYYPDRQRSILLEQCRAAKFSPEEVRSVDQVLTTDYVDLKRTDARELLLTMRDVLDGTVPPPQPVPFTFARSSVFEALYNIDRPVRTGDGTQVTLQAIGEHVALHCPDHERIRSAALNREIVMYFGLLLGIRVTQADIDAQRAVFLAERGLATDEALDAWLRRNVLSEDDLTEYLAQEAICVRLRRWILAVRGFDRGSRPFLNELRMRDQFPEWANAVAEKAMIVAAYRDQPEYRDLDNADPAYLAEIHAAHTGVRITGDARVWAEDTGFDGVTELADALRRSAIYNDVRARISRLGTLLGFAGFATDASEAST